MLTIPKEIVPRQMARGVRAAFDFGAAIADIENITIGLRCRRAGAASIDSPRAPGGPSPGSGGGRAARYLERAAEGLGAPAGPRHPGGEPERRDLPPRPGRGLVLAGEAGPDADGMAGCPGFGRPRAPLLHRVVDRLSTRRTFGRLPDRQGDRAAARGGRWRCASGRAAARGRGWWGR